MSSEMTLSRPYAKAVFDLACEDGEMTQWLDRLAFLSQLQQNVEVSALLANPDLSRDQKAELLIALYKKADNSPLVVNFIRLVAENDRLLLLSAIYENYAQLKFEYDNTIEAELITASEIDDDYIQKIRQLLSDRLGKSVIVKASIDKEILGGAVIRAGDLVIDASIKGKLAKLTNTLIH